MAMAKTPSLRLTMRSRFLPPPDHRSPASIMAVPPLRLSCSVPGSLRQGGSGLPGSAVRRRSSADALIYLFDMEHYIENGVPSGQPLNTCTSTSVAPGLGQ